MSKVLKAGILTSGGDAPGMNAAIRALVRVSACFGHRVYGINHGYQGLWNGDYREITTKDVGGTINMGGTILGTSRFPDLLQFETVKKMSAKVKKYGFDVIYVIGGNGSLKGAIDLARCGTRSIVLPGSIDNDLPGSSYSIGSDTALNTILDAVDKIKDTASSHERAFLIEVMGRDSGYLAMMSAISGGADAAIIPERKFDIRKLVSFIKTRKKMGKKNTIIIVAEGAGSVEDLKAGLQGKIPYDVRIVILGHLQRGGSPTSFDRIMASRLARYAVESFDKGIYNILCGFHKEECVGIPFSSVKRLKPKDFSNDIKTIEYLAL